MAGWSMIGEDKCGPGKKSSCSVDVVPPMLGDGKPVDLIKLFLVVREKGGYDAVSENGLWGVVAEECGLGLNLSPFVKLVYVKYLDTLHKGLEEIDCKDSIANLSDCDSIVRKVSTELSDIPKWNVLNMSTEMDSDGSEKYPVDDEESVHIGTGNGGVGNVGFQENLQLDADKNVVVDMDRSKKCVNDDDSDESISSRKRKRESMSRIVNWITGIARSPCDNVVDPLPESSKWESFGREEVWKQILLTREALFLKRNVDSGGEQSAVKKNRKMHPCMYDDQSGPYHFRERQKVTKKFVQEKTPSKPQARSKSSNTRTDSGSCIKGISDGDSLAEKPPVDLPVEKVIPLGPDFQADVPEWTGPVSEFDLKWLGKRDWPLEKVDNRLIVEREPIGKGRQDSCGCEVPKSVQCVRFHVAERRFRIKRELGDAFFHWRFDRMGEDVKLGWTADEEKKFKAIVQANPASQDKCFWDEIIKFFSSKKREVLVSYYFNVFLMQRRAHQNRVAPNNIDSDDDDESVIGSVAPSSRREAPKSPGSLLYSAKKSRKK